MKPSDKNKNNLILYIASGVVVSAGMGFIKFSGYLIQLGVSHLLNVK